MARDRSRSPFEMSSSYEEVVKLVVMREQARYSKDWTLADNIREKIHAYGVTIQDKTHTWKSSDGQTGRIPTWSEIEAGHTPETFLAQQEPRAAAMVQQQPAGGDGTEAHVKQLVQMREQARAAKDWAQSDKLREELRAMGVEISDRDKMWRSQSGASGVIMGYRGAAGPSDLEISTLVLQREKARQGGDFATSDMIRDELRAAGVQIQDREKIWRSPDGRQGSIPSWSDVQNGGGAAPAPAAPAVATAAAVGSASALQNQVIQAALAASQNPTAAMRTLQLLQSGAAAPAAPAMRAPKPPVAVPTTSANPECQEALTYIQQCQAAGRAPLDAEIEQLVLLREKFRQGKDWTAADELRTAMRSVLSVEFHEKEKRWSAPGGRQGLIPSWS